MDAMILVIDITKGIQPQTAECIVIGEITTRRAIVVLNKVDLIQEELREKFVKKARKMIAASLKGTAFAGCPVVAFTAAPSARGLRGTDGGIDDAANETMTYEDPLYAAGIEDLKAAISSLVDLRRDHADSSRGFLFYIDHCFPVKGHGTVLTGTVAKGSISCGDTIELPTLSLQRKVKSMQMFHRPVKQVSKGDRVGICVTNLDADLIERGVASDPGRIPSYRVAIASVRKVRFFAGSVKSGSKIHIIVGHHVAMAKLIFFAADLGDCFDNEKQDRKCSGNVPNVCIKGGGRNASIAADDNKWARCTSSGSPEMVKHLSQDQKNVTRRSEKNIDVGFSKDDRMDRAFDFATEYKYLEELPADEKLRSKSWVLLQFEDIVVAPGNALIVGARLDSDLHAGLCRIAFSGSIVTWLPSQERSGDSDRRQLQHLAIYKRKSREGTIARLELPQHRNPSKRGVQSEKPDPSSFVAICHGMLSKHADVSRFLDLIVQGPGGKRGVIQSGFGQSGKLRIRFDEALDRSDVGQKIVLNYKKYVFAPKSDEKGGRIWQ